MQTSCKSSTKHLIMLDNFERIVKIAKLGKFCFLVE